MQIFSHINQDLEGNQFHGHMNYSDFFFLVFTNSANSTDLNIKLPETNIWSGTLENPHVEVTLPNTTK